MSSARTWSSLAGLALSGLALLAPQDAGAYPLNPWGSMTSQGTYVLNPFLYVYGGPEFYPYVYGATGLGESMDVIGGVGLFVIPGDGGGFGFSSAELIPRYWFSESMGVALHAIYTLGAVEVGPELHGVLGGDTFAFTFNAGWRPVFGGGFSPGSVVALLAPEYNFSSQFSVFLEVNPSYGLYEGGGFGLVLVPGVGFALDPDQAHTFAVGAQIDPLTSTNDFVGTNVSFGAWYATSFGG